MSKRRLSTRSFVIVISLIIIFLLLIRLTGLEPKAQSLFLSVFKPVQRLCFELTSSLRGPESRDSSDYNQIAEACLKDKTALMFELSQLRSEISDLRSSVDAGQYLKSLPLNYINSRVIGQSLDPTTKYVTIDRGTNDHIQVGQAVVAEKGIIIGRIYEAFPDSSNVLLLTDRRSRLSAIVQNDKNSPGLVTGQLGLSLQLELVPQSEPLAPDQTVVTSGFESLIPRGLVIGSIGNIHESNTELFLSADINAPLSFDRLSILSVIIE